ncbi:NAD-dependent epimerase/dehydratase family protein [Streptomyces sp. NPDC006660]|uniref:NAD-dependent epimerase/dehydratase family protein n=1 Tax=Streptomyces sp. NPDC006660 TaxID=3156901 RepID=UPI00340E3677
MSAVLYVLAAAQTPASADTTATGAVLAAKAGSRTMTTSVLVMGGSHFLGRAVAVEALRRGWSVTVFNRGKTGRNPDGVHAIQGDRTNQKDLVRLAGIGPWNAVIDTSGMSANVVDLATQALSEAARRYIYVSTVSVYAGWPLLPLTEDLPTLAEAEPASQMPGDVVVSYGVDKAAAEKAAQTNLGRALTILRPGVILGPEEYVGRLPWWLRRVERGGRVLAPGNPDQTIAPVSPVDSRDVAVFACDRAQVGREAEIFNLTAPKNHATMESFLKTCINVTGSDANLDWVEADFLLHHGAKQWTELPLWRTYPGTWSVSGVRAHDAGFVCRPLSETVADTWSWVVSGEDAVDSERAAHIGLAREKEAALLAAWDAR